MDSLPPSEPLTVFPESSFFKENRAAALPPPAEIRDIAVKLGRSIQKQYRPPPVKIPSLGLVVKYGTAIRVVEAQTQIMVREKMQGRVPVPEVFGWTKDNGQVFIYMDLVEGETMEERWVGLSDGERAAVCGELKHMTDAWRSLEQEEGEPYIGSLNHQPLNDIFVANRPQWVGPYRGSDAVRQFHETCHIYTTADAPIVFTHNDLVPPNIILSPGPNPSVAAIADWAQSGWLPAYWEYGKSRMVGLSPRKFDNALVEEWSEKYLPMFLEPVDEERFYDPMDQFVLSWGL